jgi:hypothetical protein
MMSFLTYITGFIMKFELLPILTDYAGQNRQKFKVHKKSRNICQKVHHYAYTVQIWALSVLK